MKALSLWQPMTPVKGMPPDSPTRFVRFSVVAEYRHDAERMCEQIALEQGFSWDGDPVVRRQSAVYVP